MGGVGGALRRIEVMEIQYSHLKFSKMFSWAILK